jgi:hypothetical protein
MELVFIEEQIQPLQKYWNQNKADIEYSEMNDVNMLWNGQAPAHYVE